MDSVRKRAAVIVLMLVVMGYTVFNYVSGKVEQTSFLVYMVILGLPLVNMINLMIQEWKNSRNGML